LPPPSAGPSSLLPRHHAPPRPGRPELPPYRAPLPPPVGPSSPASRPPLRRAPPPAGPSSLRPPAPCPAVTLPAPSPPRATPFLCLRPAPARSTRGKAVKGRRSQMEPHFRGSASPVEALCGSTTGFTPGAASFRTVWQGSAWSQSQSSFWSPAKQGLTPFFRQMLTYMD
jgi:hypothetical protein